MVSFRRVDRSGPVRQLGELGSRLGPPIFRGRQFSKIRAADLLWPLFLRLISISSKSNS